MAIILRGIAILEHEQIQDLEEAAQIFHNTFNLVAMEMTLAFDLVAVA